MKVSEYKDIMDSLSRFATTRETAKGPASMIGIQSDGKLLKLISGGEQSGVIVTIREAAVDGKFTFCVPSRRLLESAGVLPSKDMVTIAASKDGLSVTASGGGVLVIKPSAPLKEAGFGKKPKDVVTSLAIKASMWGQSSRLFDEVLDKYKYLNGINIRLMKDGAYLVGAGFPATRYAAYRINSMSYDHPQDFYPDNSFWAALRAISSDGELVLCNDGFIARGGDTEVYTSSWKYDEKWAIPVLEPVGSGVSVTMDRNKLTSAVRSQSGGDGKVTLSVKGGVFSVSRPDGDGISIPATSTGEGNITLISDTLKGMLNAMTDTKKVTLTWSEGSIGVLLSAGEYEGWTLLVSKVALG